MITGETKQGDGLRKTKLLVKQHRCLKYLPTLVNTNIYTSSERQGIFFASRCIECFLECAEFGRSSYITCRLIFQATECTHLANLTVNSFFPHLISLTFLLSLRILCREGEPTHYYYFTSSSKQNSVSDCKISLPKLIICNPPSSLCPAASCCRRAGL